MMNIKVEFNLEDEQAADLVVKVLEDLVFAVHNGKVEIRNLETREDKRKCSKR